MTDSGKTTVSNPQPNINQSTLQSTIVDKRAERLKKRHKAERRFQWYGRLSITFGVCCVLFLFIDIGSKGIGAFSQAHVNVQVHFDQNILGITKNSSIEEIKKASFYSFYKKTIYAQFPEITGRKNKSQVFKLFSSQAQYQLRDMVLSDPSILGTTKNVSIIVDDDFEVYYKYTYGRNLPADKKVSRLSEYQEAFVKTLDEKGYIETKFNVSFFSNGNSTDPEVAGIKGALLGSFFTLLVTLLVSFPIAVSTAIYLEEFAPKNKITDLIEVNINNLAAVPSIIFGLLGLAIFINFFGLPRSVPLVGGLVLALMTFPTIIISSRAAIKAVPPSIREAAYGMGASKVQMVVHHVLPLAMPGMLTGTIIGMAQALGETAPLLMIGLTAFVIGSPEGILSDTNVLPALIYSWSDTAERLFIEKTSGAIIVLLAFLICMNSFAVWLRRRLERRW